LLKKTVYCFSLTLFLLGQGMVALTTWALLRTRMPRSTLFFPLYLMSIGQGGYQPSLQAFGADQLSIGDDDDDDDDTEPSATPEEKAKVKSMFFQWWYFGMCSGSLLGNSTMSYVQDNFGWGLGFAIPSAVMALSVAAFFCCTPLFKQQTKAKAASNKPSPNSVFKVLKSILASRKISLPSRDDNGDATSELEYVCSILLSQEHFL
jgi:dipeptide/tripeptide permease